VQAAFVGLTERPAVPGPYDLDGLLEAEGDHDEPLSIVWLGDSLASGVGAATPDATFPRKSAALYAALQERSVHITCLATPGARAADVLARQVPAGLTHLGPASVAVLLVGANDVGSLNRPRRFRRQYGAILDALVGSGATVVAVGLPDMGAATVMAQPLRAIAGWAGHRADRDVRRMAAQRGAHYIDINCAPPPEEKPPVYLAADNWHPNDVTYHFWADRLASFLSPLLAAGIST
jgi:lysophospholipase L1-like esterase